MMALKLADELEADEYPPRRAAAIELRRLHEENERLKALEKERVAHWMMERGYATGHGDTIEDLLKELEWQIRQKEHQVVLVAIDELRGSERDRNDMFSEGYDYALGHIKEVVKGVSND